MSLEPRALAQEPAGGDKSKSIYDTCWYCQNEVGKANVKRCGNCRMVWYCSKDCQKKAWPTHKPRCKTGANLWDQLANDPEGDDKAALHRALTKWVATWREVISNYAVHALDIANQGRDRINTQTVFIELKSRRDPQTKARVFSMVKAVLWSQEEFSDWIENADILEDDLARIKGNRGPNTVQVALVCDEQALRFFWFQLRDNGAWCEERDRETATFLAIAWPKLLEATIKSGNPEMSMSEAMMGVDEDGDGAVMDMIAEGLREKGIA